MLSHQPPGTLRFHPMVPRIGDIYMVQFDGSGSVQRGLRPGVIFSNNKGNENSPNVIALPLTSQIKKMWLPTHVMLNADECGLRCQSMVLCENPQCVPKSNLGAFISHLSDVNCSRIAEAYLLASSCISFLDLQELVTVREFALRMNAV